LIGVGIGIGIVNRFPIPIPTPRVIQRPSSSLTLGYNRTLPSSACCLPSAL